MKIAINGFGRIGRASFKIVLERIASGENIEVVAINDLGSKESLAYLLQHDSVYGNYGKSIEVTETGLSVDGVNIPVFSEKDPENLPWGKLGVDVVLECTGFFVTTELSSKHLAAGAKRVVISAPAKDEQTETKVLGGEDPEFASRIVSNASCTTNCVTPVMRVLGAAFGIEKAMLTTVHAYTSTQSLVDGPNKKSFRRGRAAAVNVVPSTTGAAKATAKVVPSLNSIFDGVALRVPVKSGSISDITALVKKNVTVEEVNNALKKASEEGLFKGILSYTEEPLVSSDIIGSSYSSIVDGEMTRVVGGNLVKVMAWYDNEWGYSNRLVDMAISISKSSNG